ncbi:hypothetical protein [Pandoraea apista]|uniref:hypothetical protein n=1 Tax=Pandoraea apista TaxID=93218 RepID=UPI000F884FC7|nr:hypothetical protein [Pandoraea apista]RUN85250.1 hypothetical protein EJ714_15225 [Pandoraea apista]
MRPEASLPNHSERDTLICRIAEQQGKPRRVVGGTHLVLGKPRCRRRRFEHPVAIAHGKPQRHVRTAIVHLAFDFACHVVERDQRSDFDLEFVALTFTHIQGEVLHCVAQCDELREISFCDPLPFAMRQRRNQRVQFANRMVQRFDLLELRSYGRHVERPDKMLGGMRYVAAH